MIEDAGAQTVVDWATAISAGPADEAGQIADVHRHDNNNNACSRRSRRRGERHADLHAGGQCVRHGDESTVTLIGQRRHGRTAASTPARRRPSRSP